mgnify:CR=1 FL=1
MLLTLVAFLVALGLLIAIHEYGHYRVAVACGVKVLRFSIGMGKPLLRWRKKGSDTEFVIAALPLGGYVKMLDEREAPVATHELHRAFNRQSVWRRIAVVAAGPLANFVLAIALYWGLYAGGVEELRPRLAAPEAAACNPAIDVTPAGLLWGIIGEFGILPPDSLATAASFAGH